MKPHRWTSTALIAAMMTAAMPGTVYSQAVPPPAPEPPALLPAPAAPMEAREFSALPMSDSFADLDRDNDGVLTPGEAERSRQVATSFQRLDENGDGRLDLAEFAQLRTPLRKD